MTQGSMVLFNEVPWLKNVLFTENGASYGSLLCNDIYTRNFIKLQINAPARSPDSIFQPDLEHESGTIHQFPADGQLLLEFLPFAEFSESFPVCHQAGDGSISWMLLPLILPASISTPRFCSQI